MPIEIVTQKHTYTFDDNIEPVERDRVLLDTEPELYDGISNEEKQDIITRSDIMFKQRDDLEKSVTGSFWNRSIPTPIPIPLRIVPKKLRETATIAARKTFATTVANVVGGTVGAVADFMKSDINLSPQTHIMEPAITPEQKVALEEAGEKEAQDLRTYANRIYTETKRMTQLPGRGAAEEFITDVPAAIGQGAEMVASLFIPGVGPFAAAGMAYLPEYEQTYQRLKETRPDLSEEARKHRAITDAMIVGTIDLATGGAEKILLGGVEKAAKKVVERKALTATEKFFSSNAVVNAAKLVYSWPKVTAAMTEGVTEDLQLFVSTGITEGRIPTGGELLTTFGIGAIAGGAIVGGGRVAIENLRGREAVVRETIDSSQYAKNPTLLRRYLSGEIDINTFTRESNEAGIFGKYGPYTVTNGTEILPGYYKTTESARQAATAMNNALRSPVMGVPSVAPIGPTYYVQDTALPFLDLDVEDVSRELGLAKADPILHSALADAAKIEPGMYQDFLDKKITYGALVGNLYEYMRTGRRDLGFSQAERFALQDQLFTHGNLYTHLMETATAQKRMLPPDKAMQVLGAIRANVPDASLQGTFLELFQNRLYNAAITTINPATGRLYESVSEYVNSPQGRIQFELVTSKSMWNSTIPEGMRISGETLIEGISEGMRPGDGALIRLAFDAANISTPFEELNHLLMKRLNPEHPFATELLRYVNSKKPKGKTYRNVTEFDRDALETIANLEHAYLASGMFPEGTPDKVANNVLEMLEFYKDLWAVDDDTYEIGIQDDGTGIKVDEPIEAVTDAQGNALSVIRTYFKQAFFGDALNTGISPHPLYVVERQSLDPLAGWKALGVESISQKASLQVNTGTSTPTPSFAHRQYEDLYNVEDTLQKIGIPTNPDEPFQRAALTGVSSHRVVLENKIARSKATAFLRQLANESGIYVNSGRQVPSDPKRLRDDLVAASRLYRAKVDEILAASVGEAEVRIGVDPASIKLPSIAETKKVGEKYYQLTKIPIAPGSSIFKESIPPPFMKDFINVSPVARTKRTDAEVDAIVQKMLGSKMAMRAVRDAMRRGNVPLDQMDVYNQVSFFRTMQLMSKLQNTTSSIMYDRLKKELDEWHGLTSSLTTNVARTLRQVGRRYDPEIFLSLVGELKKVASPRERMILAQLRPEEIVALRELDIDDATELAEVIKAHTVLDKMQNRIVVNLSKLQDRATTALSTTMAGKPTQAELNHELALTLATFKGKHKIFGELLTASVFSNMLLTVPGRVSDLATSYMVMAADFGVFTPLEGALDAIATSFGLQKARQQFATDLNPLNPKDLAVMKKGVVEGVKRLGRILSGKDNWRNYANTTRYDIMLGKAEWLDALYKYGTAGDKAVSNIFTMAKRIVTAIDASAQLTSSTIAEQMLQNRLGHLTPEMRDAEIRKMAEVAAKGLGLRGEDAKEYIARCLVDHSELIQSVASEYARQHTMQQRSGVLSNAILSVRNAIDQKIFEATGIRPMQLYCMPFVRTLCNLAKFQLELMPSLAPAVLSGMSLETSIITAALGPLTSLSAGRSWKGVIARQLVANSLMMFFKWAMENGWIWGAPKDDNERQQWMKDNKPAFGWRFAIPDGHGGELSWNMQIPTILQSFIHVINAIQVHDVVVKNGPDSAEAKLAKVNAHNAIMRFIEDQTLMRGPLHTAKGESGALKSFFNTMVPFASVLRMANDTYKAINGKANTIKSTRSFQYASTAKRVNAEFNAAMSQLPYGENFLEFLGRQIPGFESTIPEYTDYFGQPITRAKILGFNLPKQWLPVDTPSGIQRVEAEFSRLGWYPDLPLRKFNLNGRIPIELDDAQYRSYCLYYGQLVSEQIDRVIGSYQYQSLPEYYKKEQLAKALIAMRNQAKARIVQAYPDLVNTGVSRYKEEIKRRLANE